MIVIVTTSDAIKRDQAKHCNCDILLLTEAEFSTHNGLCCAYAGGCLQRGHLPAIVFLGFLASLRLIPRFLRDPAFYAESRVLSRFATLPKTLAGAIKTPDVRSALEPSQTIYTACGASSPVVCVHHREIADGISHISKYEQVQRRVSLAMGTDQLQLKYKQCLSMYSTVNNDICRCRRGCKVKKSAADSCTVTDAGTKWLIPYRGPFQTASVRERRRAIFHVGISKHTARGNCPRCNADHDLPPTCFEKRRQRLSWERADL